MEMEYSEPVKNQIEIYERKISQAKGLDEDVKLVLSLYPDMNIWLDSEVNVYWCAKSMDEVKEMLKTFAKEKIFLAEDGFRESETNPVWRLQGKCSIIRLSPSWHVGETEGATCRLVQTGSETRTYPTYKLVCDKEV